MTAPAERLSDHVITGLARDLDLDLTHLITEVGPTARPGGERRTVMVFLTPAAPQGLVDRLTSAVRARGWGADVSASRTKVYVYEPARRGKGGADDA